MDSTESIAENNVPPKSKLPLVFAGLLILALVFVAGYLLATKNQPLPSSANPKNITQNKFPLATQPNITLSSPTEPTNWKTYINKEIGFEFKYPPSFEDFGALTEKYQESEVGFNYCLKPTNETSFKFFKQVYAGGGGCFTDTFAVSANSFDYERGSMGSFLDFHGYEKDGTDIRVRGYSTLGDAIPKSFYKIITNQNGVEIVKIYGQPTDPNNPFRSDHPGEGFIGALINTQSKNYPGIALTANSKTTATEEVFDQILSSIKILPAEETVLPYINYDYKWKNYVAKDLFAISYPKEGYYSAESKEKLSSRFIVSNMSEDQKRRDIMNAEYFDIDITVVYNMGRAYFDELLRGRYPDTGNYIREKAILNGIEFDKFTTKSQESGYPYGFRAEYYLLKGITCYDISIYGRSKVEDFRPKVDQTLSTFKFL